MFVDDSISHGRTFADYLKHQRAFFGAVRKRQWRVNPLKLRLGYGKVKLLGYIVGSRELGTDPQKIEAVRALKPPTNVKEL